MKLNRQILIFCSLMLAGISAVANIPGGGTGTGANVTLTDNGTTATMANGIVSIVITKASANIYTINYTYNNSGSPQTYQVLSGGKDNGEFYWELGGFGSGSFNYSVVANNGNYAEVDLFLNSTTNGTVDIHFSMLRGSTGFYVTGIWSHRNGDAAMGTGEERDNIYISPTFTWNSIDAAHNFQYNLGGAGRGGTAGAVGVGGQGAPVEVSLWTNGIAAGRYEDKYKYCADFGVERAWGWSSVNNPAAGFTGKNIGIWHVLASAEFYNGGPMKPELMDAPMVNMINGGHYQMGSDSNFGNNETWTRVSGPYFIYFNNVTNTMTNAFQTAQALFTDAQAQAVAEQSAWPYYWFTNASYAPASQRGTVSGQIVISDSGNPNASASNLWVGVVRQPITTDGVYDFQEWEKPYQFWVKSGANGNFIIPNVIATNNYTLYAFGPGANGTFMSQNQSGGNPTLLYNLPATPFSVTVTGGATNNLGSITWTPSRVGATVFEIGYPDRTSKKFRHGDDWWVGDVGPSPTNPVPVWSKFLEYPFDFPSGPNYVVGQSRWSTDWNFVQPVVVDSAGNENASTSTITFNLATAPTNGATASLYIGTASDDAGPLIVSVNGSVLVSGSGGVTATPSSLPSTGYFPYNSGSDTTIRDGVSAVFSDERINFPTNYLRQGQNTITLNMRKGGSLDNHAMYDYIRLELTGYIPPPPASVAAYAGNNCNLVCWPVTPGATSYNIFSTTNSGSNYVSIASGVTGPVCGSGLNNATWLDTNAANGTTYFYVVQSVNPTGASTNSPQSPGATPDAGISTSAPAAPTGLTVSSVAHHSVTLNWSASPGANFYTIYRSTLVDTLGGASNILSTIVLNNTNTGTSYTDTSPTDGSIYSYSVTATSAGGTSTNSISAVGVPLPAPPASAPASLTGNYSLSTSNVVLNWSAVSGAVGYIIRQATSANGPFIYVDNITETTYTDTAVTPGTYYYTVTAVNAAGVSTNATVKIISPPTAPTSLSAVAGDSQIILTWTAVANATGYVLKSGTSSGNETTVVLSGYTGTSYTNTGLANGTTYYYVVAGTNAGGLGPNSPEASATPGANIVINARNLTWKGDGAANVWDVNGMANWLSNSTTTIFNNGDAVTFDNTGSNNVAVALTGTLQPALTTFNASKNYTFGGSGSIAGTNILVKSGTGTLTINTTNTFSGGTIISNGLVAPGSAGANLGALGTGSITFDGGTLEFNGYTGSTTPDYLGNTNALIVPLGSTGTIHVPQRFLTPGLNGPLSGSGTLNLFVTYVRGDISGNWANFFGQLNVTTASTGDFRINNINGFPNAKLNVGANVFMYSRTTANAVIPIGEFAAASATVSAGQGSSAGTQSAVTWRVGGLNTDATNAAIFQGTTALIKEGTGVWTLTGASTHSGTTTVSNGTLLVNGSFNGSPVTISGGTLGGVGIISGAAVAVNSGGFAPGLPATGLGTLTISNNVTLAAGSTTFMQIQHSPPTNSAAKISGRLNENGALNVTDLGAGGFSAGDNFKLFSAGTFSGAFTNFILPALDTNLVWNTNALKISGTLSVAAYAPPVIGNLAVAGTNFTGGGGNGIPYWTYYVLAATNLAADWTIIATNQFDANGDFIFTNSIAPDQPQTFFRLQLQ